MDNPQLATAAPRGHGVSAPIAFALAAAEWLTLVVVVTLWAVLGPASTLTNLVVAYAAATVVAWLTQPARDLLYRMVRHPELRAGAAGKAAGQDIRDDIAAHPQYRELRAYLFWMAVLNLMWPFYMLYDAHGELWLLEG